jgi:signal transduction histidine kinase
MITITSAQLRNVVSPAKCCLRRAQGQEQVSQETRRRLADIISFLPDATLVIDREGKVIAWNAIEELTASRLKLCSARDYEYAIPFMGSAARS